MDPIIAKIKELEEKKERMKNKEWFEKLSVSHRQNIREHANNKTNITNYISPKEWEEHSKLVQEEKETDYEQLVMKALEKQLQISKVRADPDPSIPTLEPPKSQEF